MRRALAAVAALVAALAASCAPLRPWERELLAHRCMDPQARPEEQRAEQHMLGAREASRGASGEVGGGCGCK